MEGLELLAHVGRVQQLNQHSFPWTETAGFCLGDRGQRLCGMIHEEFLLGVHPRLPKTGTNEAVFQPVPADVARQVLLARSGEKVSAHLLPVVSATRTGGNVFSQFLPKFAVVECDEKPFPVLSWTNQALQHWDRAQR